MFCFGQTTETWKQHNDIFYFFFSFVFSTIWGDGGFWIRMCLLSNPSTLGIIYFWNNFKFMEVLQRKTQSACVFLTLISLKPKFYVWTELRNYPLHNLWALFQFSLFQDWIQGLKCNLFSCHLSFRYVIVLQL